MRKVKQSTAKNVMVLMVDSTDHVTGKTGLTLTIEASKNGGAFGSISPTVTERASGWYSLALTASHTDTLGDLALHITGAAADPADMVLLVEAGATDADVSTRLATAGYTAPDNATITLIAGYTDTIESRLPAALVSGRMDVSVGAISANAITASSVAAAALNGKGDWNIGKTGYSLTVSPPTAAAIRTEIDTNSTKLDVAISSRLAGASYVAPDNATIAAIAGYVDTEIAAILAAVDTEVGAIKAKTDGLPADTSATLTALTALVDDLEGRLSAVRAGLLDNLTNLDAAISSRLATASYAAAPSAAAIRTEMDSNSVLLQNIEQEALGARTLNLGTGVETVSRTGRTNKTRTLYKDAAKTQPVSAETDPVLGTGELT